MLKAEIEAIKGASHPNLLVYSGVERAASGLFLVREDLEVAAIRDFRYMPYILRNAVIELVHSAPFSSA